MIYHKYNRINGRGEVEVHVIEGFVPEMPAGMQTAGFSPYTGKPWGIPDPGCYGCHHTINGAFSACDSHGVRHKVYPQQVVTAINGVPCAPFAS